MDLKYDSSPCIALNEAIVIRDAEQKDLFQFLNI